MPFTVPTGDCIGAGWELFNPKSFPEQKNYSTSLAKFSAATSKATLRVTKPLCKLFFKYFPESLFSILRLPGLGDRQDAPRWTRQSALAQVQKFKGKKHLGSFLHCSWAECKEGSLPPHSPLRQSTTFSTTLSEFWFPKLKNQCRSRGTCHPAQLCANSVALTDCRCGQSGLS